MSVSLQQLKPITEDVSLDEITIGNSKFKDDVWDLTPYMEDVNIRKNKKKVDFSYIESEDMKFTVKQYAYHRLGEVKPRTVFTKINGRLPRFIEFCSKNNISSFTEVTKKIFLDYVNWLKEDYEINQGKNLSRKAGYKATLIVQNIIKKGQTKDWKVSQISFDDVSANKLWEPQKGRKQRKTKPIPKDVFNQILDSAVNGDSSFLTRAGIIIQSQTGLRISEVLSIEEGCIKNTSEDNDYMEMIISKTENEPVKHKVFVNDLVKKTVKELEEYTKDLREESGLKKLFLYKYGKIRPLKGQKFNENRIKTFVKQNDIRGKDGELYPIHTHQFRATFVRELIKQGVSIGHIKKHFNHVSIEMTDHYLSLEQDEIKDKFGELVLDPDSKIAGKRADEIEQTLQEEFKGKTEEEIDRLIEDLSKTMSFNPLPTGVCLYDFRRGNCTDGNGCFMYNCSNYVTEVTFYPVLKKELELIEKKMSRFKELDRERDWQRQKLKYDHLKPLVEDLEEKMDMVDLKDLKGELDEETYNRLEAKINGKEGAN
ncbi:tyrosine-type recombinase/integrase [Halanaerobacter jeridensis]|uniref:Integrase n=1 Tax=Halanaerobacter jeridensis TaxID=706427 RepID=A0A939BN39_9FIRM|nr:site-specific integrase [Halanaerobacter jeridensis]MBM7558110.1 integrase [Halanaerobacter jeridensis]